jgi:type I restriction enzyme S subunit
MEVKKGYKKTEVGVIPEDWSEKTLREISLQITDGDHITPQRTSQGFFLLSARNIRNGYIDLSDVDYVAQEEYARMRTRCAPVSGDILVSCSGNGLGRVAIVPVGLHCVLVRSAALIKAEPRKASSSFLHHWLRGRHAQNQIANGLSRAAQPNLFLGSIQQIRAPLPPTLLEQEAIAGALSDADAWIESLEQLIAKKRQIKQGAMQELLTGKRRLPGFSGKWVKTTLGELGRWSGGMTPSMANSKYWDGGNFPWVSSGDVKSVKLNDTTQHITTTAIRESATTVMPAGGIIIVNRSGILRRYLPVSLLMRDMAINQDIKGLILKPGLCSEFVLYFILHAGPEILASCMKAGTTVESIELSWLKRFAVQLPNMEEQTAIATVLSDMDTEIEALESKLAKAREIKQGMMQELLTGRIRLIEN